MKTALISEILPSIFAEDSNRRAVARRGDPWAPWLLDSSAPARVAHHVPRKPPCSMVSKKLARPSKILAQCSCQLVPVSFAVAAPRAD